MIPYSKLIDDALIGKTPQMKYETLIWMYSVLERIAYPKRGSIDESSDLDYYAAEIQDRLSVNDLTVDK